MKRYAPLMVIAAASLWGSVGIFVRQLNTMGLDSMSIVAVRSIISAVILFPLVAVKDPSLLKVKPGHIWALAGSGLISIVFFSYCYFATIAMMDLSIAAVLLYTSPIFVMLLSIIIFKEKLTVKKVIALILAFSGCCLVCGILSSNTPVTFPGLMLGLGSAVGYAMYSIFSRFSINYGLKPLTIIIYTFLFAGIGAAFLSDFSIISLAFSNYGLRLAGWAAAYTVTTTVLPYLLYTTGLQYMENGTASVIASIEPVVATLVGIIAYSEIPTVSAAIGIILVLTALTMLNIEPRRKTAKN